MDVSSPFHAELLEEVHVAADARGYDVVVSPLTRAHGESRAIETLLDFRCEALLLLGPAARGCAGLPRRAARRRRHRRRLAASGVDVVRAADDRGVALAVEHLAGLGHRAIVFVDGPRGPIAGLRRQGYRQAVRQLLGADAVQVVEGAAPRRTAPGSAALGPEPPRRSSRSTTDARSGSSTGSAATGSACPSRCRSSATTTAPRPPRHRRPHHSEPVPGPWPRPPWPRLSSGSKAPGARPSTSSSRRTWSSAARPPHRPPDPLDARTGEASRFGVAPSAKPCAPNRGGQWLSPSPPGRPVAPAAPRRPTLADSPGHELGLGLRRQAADWSRSRLVEEVALRTGCDDVGDPVVGEAVVAGHLQGGVDGVDRSRSTVSIARPKADEICSRLAIRLMSLEWFDPAAWKRAGLKKTASPLASGSWMWCGPRSTPGTAAGRRRSRASTSGCAEYRVGPRRPACRSGDGALQGQHLGEGVHAG